MKREAKASGASFRVPDALWGRIRPLLPAARPKPKGGRTRNDDRKMLDGIFYVLRTGIQWKALPWESVRGRAVLVLDDILDVGQTLAAVRERLLAEGAASVHCAVLTEKETGRPKPLKADFVGLKLPNRYVFGCGMDVSGAWRNLPAIYAMKES